VADFFLYRGTVMRWVDGDTFDAEVDLGFHVVTRLRFRLHGVNTPERGRALYKEATEHAQDMCPVGSHVRIRSEKAGKFGRWLAVVWPEHGDVSVNDSLIDNGLGVAYFGGKR
jgi:endonuclease YncB( thermonuclease family)